jgi:hypothetical protein
MENGFDIDAALNRVPLSESERALFGGRPGGSGPDIQMLAESVVVGGFTPVSEIDTSEEPPGDGLLVTFGSISEAVELKDLAVSMGPEGGDIEIRDGGDGYTVVFSEEFRSRSPWVLEGIECYLTEIGVLDQRSTAMLESYVHEPGHYLIEDDDKHPEPPPGASGGNPYHSRSGKFATKGGRSSLSYGDRAVEKFKYTRQYKDSDKRCGRAARRMGLNIRCMDLPPGADDKKPAAKEKSRSLADRIKDALKKVGAKVNKGLSKAQRAANSAASAIRRRIKREDVEDSSYFTSVEDLLSEGAGGPLDADMAAASVRDLIESEHCTTSMSTVEEILGESSMPTVPATIIKQLTGGGPGRLRAMLGAKSILYDDDMVKVKFPNGQRSRPNGFMIKLMPSDTYDIEFHRGNKVVKSLSGVYASRLRELVEKETGLYMSL